MNRLEVTSVSGEHFVFDGTYPKGHVRNPAAQSDVDAKFDALARDVLTPERRDAIRAAVERTEEYPDAAVLVDALIWR